MTPTTMINPAAMRCLNEVSLNQKAPNAIAAGI
jgi:hypothetical protein